MTGKTETGSSRWPWQRRARSAGEARTAASDGSSDGPTRGLLNITDPGVDLTTPDGGPVLLHALDGFLSAGQAGRLAADQLVGDDLAGDVVAEIDADALYDYRARRPPLAFDQDHYAGYQAPRLDVRRMVDAAGTPYLLLAGPEPDYRWEDFIDAVRDVVDAFGVRLVVGIGAVPMGVPHTRPIVVTAHATRPELVDRPNLWTGRLLVPASAQAVLELRLGESGHDALGYVAHVPHYVGGVEFAPAAVTLLEAAGAAAGLTFDLDALRETAENTIGEVDRQVSEQEGGEVLSALEEQYDTFSRGAGQSMLARDEELPSADQLGQQFEQFLAGLDRREGRD